MIFKTWRKKTLTFIWDWRLWRCCWNRDNQSTIC